MTLRHILQLASCLSLSLTAITSQAIVIRHDKADSAYQQHADRFAPYIAYLDRCTATVLNDYWLVTAAHCVNPAEQYPLKIQHLDNDYAVLKIIRHPDFTQTGEPDLALLQLRWPLKQAKPAALYRKHDELNKVITIAGKGTTGNGVTGDAKQDNLLRAATNTINSVEGKWLTFEFNQGDNATPLEGVSGSGDSGGPAFILENGTPYLAGVSCCQESETQGAYGALEYYSRVSTELDWLQQQMAANPPKPESKHPLVTLLRSGDQHKALALIQQDTSWQQATELTEALLTHAFIAQDLDLFKALIAAQPAMLSAELQGLPLLDYALKQGNSLFFSYLIDAGADVSHLGFRKQHYLSRLMWQYFHDDANALAAKLLQAGLDINQQDERGDSALHMAGFYGSLERIQFLLEHGADINLRDKQGNTLLITAQKRGQRDIVEYLLAKGAEKTD
ncbi:ankyrin repeat domain-containing protein [Rheinheimera pleomorphica]|uniref:ankyrin repeat domain-containing protein n=1 Tax=Rheinheimera pleomorphica TaxID=2703963 RepID=UPI001424586F|nr:ankyrin repeat domain-containing protein [Rheinheimera pleomorphica]